MGNSLSDPADPHSTRPRFSMGRLTGGGLVACLWLWTSASPLRSSELTDPSPATAYQSALDRFNHADYPQAMSFLEQAPAGHDAHEQADILNLKGAILLREHHNAEARAAFNEAARLDPGFWAARYNEIEVGFREKRYAESHRQFSALLARTSLFGRLAERHFIEYKLMLTDLLDGKEKPALDFIAAHRGDQTPPLTWYYLNAALEYQRGHTASGAAWLQQAGMHSAPAAGQVYADSFAQLGWPPRGDTGTERLDSRERVQGDAGTTAQTDAAPAALTKTSSARRRTAAPAVSKPASATVAAVNLPPDRGGSPSVPAPTKTKAPVVAAASAVPAKESLTRFQNARETAPSASLTTINVVALMPDRGQSSSPSTAVPVRDAANTAGPRPAVRFGFNPLAGNTAEEQMPPSEVGLVLSAEELNNPAHGTPTVAGVLAKSSSGRKSHSSPSASPADGGSAEASPLPSPDATPSATPKPEATPSGTPSPAFIQKYEAAMVQFLQKDYPGAKKLIDEADAIQPGQPNSVTLHNQIFKQYYEAAYTAYQHADYPAALTQLDGADTAGTNAQNQSDAYNLRGLVLSKQRNYEGAEAMFHKAVLTDPGLWAAKFNYAEVPFNYRNFTVARARFEELFSQTDPAKQPVEAELTQFKVFLTLLLEGKEDAARTFMQHFNFSGATPARYFCQAALNFYSGDVDKAQGWIDSARKEYPPRKSSSFLEAFYRVGWLTDPNAPAAGTPAPALAAASPSVAPAEPTVAPAMTSPAPAVAAASPSVQTPSKSSPTASPAVAAASPAVASSSPAVLPAFRILVTPPPTALATPVATPSPSASLVAKATPSASLVAKATPSASPAPTLVAKASATPTMPPAAVPTATVVAKATAAPSPSAPVVAKASATVAPSPSVPAVVKATPTVAITTPTPAIAKVSPTAAPSSPVPAVAKASATAAPSPSVPAVAKASATAAPTAFAPAVAAMSPTPAPTAPAVAATSPRPSVPVPAASESPESTPAENEEAAAEPTSTGGDVLRVTMVGGVFAYFLYVVTRIGMSAMGRKSKRGTTADASSSYQSRKAAKADELEAKR